jgi:hypothetical protein
MCKSAHKTTDLENAAFFSVPGFRYRRQTLQGFILFNTLALYGELRDIYVQTVFFPEISQPRRSATAVQRTCCTLTCCGDADRGESESKDHDISF